MKLIAPLLLAPLVIALNPASAQHTHTSRAAARGAAASSGPKGGCVKVGELSPNIPGLPLGSCPKALYTLSRVPAIKLDYASPMENLAVLRETFGLDTSTITLGYSDIKVGSGALAVPGKFFSILYTGYLADGTVFDASSKHGGDPIVIQYGKHNVIPGWDTGLDGMHVGGKRRLYIPYELAYGANGQPPSIPAKAELIFDVELVSQSDARPAPKPAPAPPAPASPPPSTKPATAPPTSMNTPATPNTPPTSKTQ
jgi:peptidylprolyl isomerase